MSSQRIEIRIKFPEVMPLQDDTGAGAVSQSHVA